MTDQISYGHLKSTDIYSLIWPLIESKSFMPRIPDGKLIPVLEGIQTQTPWIHNNENDIKFHCRLWDNVSFKIISKNLPEPYRFVPRGCQECWKVTVKLKTLEQLFAIHEMQKKMNMTCKCGAEMRDTVKGLYGAYFYNKSLEEGLECYEIVKAELLKNDLLAPLIDEVDQDGRTTRIILKRGCTEYEHLIGPSDKWEISETQNVFENMVEEYFDLDQNKGGQPPQLITHIKCGWIEWAACNNDMTYLKYTDGAGLPKIGDPKKIRDNIPDYITYHQPELKGD